jgi:hypothetical protein
LTIAAVHMKYVIDLSDKELATKENKFEFNKDAGMKVCKARHVVIHRVRTGKQWREKPSKYLLF